VRLLAILIIVLFLPFAGFCQYSHEWIQPGQSYYRIPVAHQGVYRLTYADLQNAGVPVGSIDPRLIQVLHRGKEQAIFVQGQADAVFHPDDFIEFFGRANDGTLDKDLYKPSALQPHAYYNLYSDTTAYFLTWSLTATPGKRATLFDEVNVTNIPKETFHNESLLLVNAQQYATGQAIEIDRAPFQRTEFDQGEGWTGTAIRQSEFIDYQIEQISERVEAGGMPLLEILLVGRDRIPHVAEVRVGPLTSSLRLATSQSFADYETSLVTVPLNWSDIGADGKLMVRLSAPAAATNRFQFSVSYLKLTFPQSFQAGGLTEKTFYLKSNVSGKSYVEFDNAPAGLRVWDVTDEENITIIGTRPVAAGRSALVPSTQTGRKVFAFTATRSAAMKKINFRFIDPQQADYIIISHRQLMKPASGYADAVKAYAGYRASGQGGLYDTLVMPVDLLYNQFNFGETSPRAIYQFMRFLVEKGNPRYLFLIGKGRDVNSGFHRMVNPGTSELKDFVPTAGYPASDMTFTAGLANSTYEPAVPTGRLTALTPADVAAYLNKVKEYESMPAGQAWQKKGLHLSGGIQPGELGLFRYYLGEFETIAEADFWGASITTIAKREPSPVELINISDQVNAGVNLVTFFGHSSSSTIDIDIGFATDPVMGYNNPGKYPAFLINGCTAGSFFINHVLFGENWMHAPNRGARNFIAHSAFGLASTLRRYSSLFYSIGFSDTEFVTKGIGDVQKEVGRRYMLEVPVNTVHISQVQQMVLLGDPAVQLFRASKPDYEAQSAWLHSFDGKPVTTLTDTFAIKVVVNNKGLSVSEPLKVEIMRTLANGVSLTYDSLFNPVRNSDTLLFKIPRSLESGGGNNSFRIRLDPDNAIDELDERNNELILPAFIASNTTVNLLPNPYGIVNQASVRLLWQSTNPFSTTRDYQIELDSTIAFNSPFLVKKKVKAKVLGSVQVSLAEKDSTVYFWRTRFDQPRPDESNEWTVASFSYIKNSGDGWAQLSKDQLGENSFIDIINEGKGKPFRFEETASTIAITTFGSNHPAANTDVSVRINGTEFNLATQGQPCRSNTLNIVAFHKSSAVPYAAIPFVFEDPRTCGREPQLINSFRMHELETGLNDDLPAAINRISLSDSVVLFSIGDAGFSSWSSNIITKLGELGISPAQISSLTSGEPLIVFGKKGAAPGTAQVMRATGSPLNEQLLFATRQITGRKTEGTMKSVSIGPATQWNRLYFNKPNAEPADSITFLIYKMGADGSEELLTDRATNGFDLSAIDASDFPFLRIAFFTKDEVNQTPAGWKNWVVLYEPAPEGVLLFKGNGLQHTLQEGQSWSSSFGFANISGTHFSQPLKATWEVFTRNTQQRLNLEKSIPSPAPGDTTFFEITSTTIGKVGSNDVLVSVNRNNQSEIFTNNNFIYLPDHLLVKRDQTPPVLQVLIDGRIIANDDFISPNPLIQILMKDENPYLVKNDLMGMRLLLSYPCGGESCPFTEVNLDGPDVKWFPASATSDFRIDFTPTGLPDGRYVLAAEATDASGNKSGPDRYEISFQVKNKTDVVFSGVYPNPSSIGFFFSFQLSGQVLPERFSLEIFSSTGQRVCLFGEEDVRKFFIGRNQLIWNGADSTGKTPGGGLYFYRLTMTTGGEETVFTGKLIQTR
jgi:hypothetical protein